MAALVRWVLAAAIVLLIAGVPLAFYRAQYTHAKRFREVTPGRFYRSGQMTAEGFRETIERYNIKTVINLQHETPDPNLPNNWLGKGAINESELCRTLGVRYELITPDILPEPNTLETPPPAVEDFLKILNDESAYPVLIHCKAGLHRTGRLTAIYRMQYEGWTVGEAVREARANGYGYHMASEADEFLIQFVQNYKVCPQANPIAPATHAKEGERPMMTTLDRMFMVSFIRSYLIVWTSLLSLYVVIDLFTNVDDFGKQGGGLSSVVEHIIGYYGYRISQIFDLMAEAITLMAAMFTVAWLQRNNELLPQLSAGIPTRRVIRPILIGAGVTLALGPLNSELIIPRIADQLMKPRDDPEGSRAIVLMGAYDREGVHIEGMAGWRRERKIVKFYATFPESSPCGMIHMVAEEAVYIPPGEGPLSGGWLMKGTDPEILPGSLPQNLTMLDPGRYFLKTEEADFDAVSRGGTWFLYASTQKLEELLARPEPRRQGKVAVLFHMRITRPVVGVLLVLLGLSVILRNPNRHVFISVGLCLTVCAFFYGLVIGCKFMGNNDYISPPLAAWLPVLIFGPITLVSFDAIHT